MPHDHHFLSRLDRVTDQQLQLALNLYRDHELVRLILDYFGTALPPDADTVAISLVDSGRGPHILVARNGHFVTCLAEGMVLAQGTPVIKREQLDRLGGSMQVVRDAIASDEYEQRRERMHRITDRILDSPDRLTREEFETALAVSPLLDEWFGKVFGRAVEGVFGLRDLVACIRKPGSRERDALREWWRCAWTLGVGSMIRAHDPQGRWEQLSNDGRCFMSFCTVSQGVAPIALRGLWAAGKVGEPLVESYRVELDCEHPRDKVDVLHSIASLAVIAHRNPMLAPQVREILQLDRLRRIASPQMAAYAGKLVEVLLRGIDEPSSIGHSFVDNGRARAVERSKDFPVGSPFRFERKEDVPEPIACSYAANLLVDFLNTDAGLEHLICATPWLGRARPEELLLPGACLQHHRATWSAEQTMEALAPLRRGFLRSAHRPAASPKTGPNEPCPCGSGRKFKKCCGDPASRT